MCFGGLFGGGKNTAQKEAERARQETEAREAKRQADIAAGKVGIDDAFKQFDDSYYGGYANDYTGYYLPQLEQQFGDASAKLIAALAGRGTLESSAGNLAQSKLLDTYNTNRTGIANEAQDASNRLKGTVENTKTDLYALNAASADPQGMSARAVGQATSLVAPPTTSPLSQVFASFLQPYMNAQAASNNRVGARYASPYSNTSRGAGRVIP